jgi:Domain of unknown function (DUF4926)
VDIEQFSRVKIVTSRFESEGVFFGMLGYVIECYPDGAFEVEISDSQGVTVAQFVAGRSDLELDDPKGVN